MKALVSARAFFIGWYANPCCITMFMVRFSGAIHLLRKAFSLGFGLCLLSWAFTTQAREPIEAIPLSVDLDLDKARLGYQLYIDQRLSRDRTISCNSCHDLYNGGVDHRKVSIGVEGASGLVNAPTTWNAVFNFRQFWNGRAKNLREQAAGPVHNPVEMDMNAAEVRHRLSESAEYRAQFSKIYDAPPNLDDALDAIAEFEKGLITPNAPFDQYLRGETVLPRKALQGYRLFKTLGCITCHNGINVGGNSYQYLGVVIPVEQKKGTKADRYAVTGRRFDRNRYKVPTLRNVSRTEPYFHDASAATLDEAIRVMAYHNLGYLIEEEEVEKIKAFLHSLNGETPWILKTLFPGRDIQP